jgi:hypothetical protein
MSALSIQPTFPIFTETDGLPLENGYIWVGAANLDPQGNPINVYWDAALTIAAAQPIRTLNGYPSRSGTPARLYVNSDYSIRVQDKNGSVMYSAPAATERYSEVVFNSNASQVIYDPAGLGAVPTTVQAKLREIVSVKDFGAVGDGVTDDTAAVHAAINFAKSRRGAVYFPVGTYRVTSGYTDVGNYQDVRLYGESSTREFNSGVAGSHIRLDSASPSSFFYRVNSRIHLQIENLTFSCAQYVLDRKFIAFNAIANSFSFDNLNFESVEKPICFELDCYFQSSTITNVQFRSSGSIHSEVGNSSYGQNLRATLLVLIDVHHEGGVPINTDKIVCDLSALRWVQATNLLLEGALPQSGWTVLRLQNPYNPDWSRDCYATFHSFWSEWGGPSSLNDVWQTGGRVVWQGPQFSIDVNRQYKLEGKGAVEVRNASFSGDGTPVKDLFDVEDYLCQVIIHDSNGRDFTTAKTTPNFTLNNCSEARDGLSNLLIGTNFSNTRSETLWVFDGGYPDPGRVTFNTSSGTTSFPSVDATFGRKLVIVPSGNTINLDAQGLVRTKTVAGQQVSIAYRMKMPVFTGGQLIVGLTRNGSVVGTAVGIPVVNSNIEVEGIFQFVDTIGGASTLGFSFTSSSMTGVSGNLELYYAAILLGKDGLQTTIPSFPNNVITFATTTPSVGEWKRGDIIYNSSPSALGTPAWSCVASGTPGTWSAMANLV